MLIDQLNLHKKNQAIILNSTQEINVSYIEICLLWPDRQTDEQIINKISVH